MNGFGIPHWWRVSSKRLNANVWDERCGFHAWMAFHWMLAFGVGRISFCLIEWQFVAFFSAHFDIMLTFCLSFGRLKRITWAANLIRYQQITKPIVWAYSPLILFVFISILFYIRKFLMSLKVWSIIIYHSNDKSYCPTNVSGNHRSWWCICAMQRVKYTSSIFTNAYEFPI